MSPRRTSLPRTSSPRAAWSCSTIGSRTGSGSRGAGASSGVAWASAPAPASAGVASAAGAPSGAVAGAASGTSSPVAPAGFVSRSSVGRASSGVDDSSGAGFSGAPASLTTASFDRSAPDDERHHALAVPPVRHVLLLDHLLEQDDALEERLGAGRAAGHVDV